MKGGSILITGGRVIDPATESDHVRDVLIEAGKICRVGEAPLKGNKDLRTIDARGLVVTPGFVDLHCHLREPGFEDKETISSGARAAAKGGYTTICCMPNTNPPLDTRAGVDFIKARCAADGVVRVIPIGCITKGRKGLELAEMGEMARAGVAGFSDDGESVPGSRLMRYALEYSRSFGLPVIEHCEDKALSADGMVNEGRVATRLGLRGIPAAAEEIVVARDLSLAALTGAWLHVAHVSTAGSVELIRRAREKGVRVTAEVTPHHLTLTEERVMGSRWGPGATVDLGPSPLPPDAYDTFAKVSPPLRTEEDRKALVQGLKDGTIDAIATDHAPHTWMDKACEFGLAAFGASVFDTSLGSLLGLVQRGEVDLPLIVSKLTFEPGKILSTSCGGLGTLSPGSGADVTVFDPEAEWLVKEEDLASRGKNNPFIGSNLRGKVMATIVGGVIVYQDPALQARSRP
ncbi:MAG: dihydroorotase [Chloroflexi bacterium]|nr:dihydroorotase [Chloroflexota bacterium]